MISRREAITVLGSIAALPLCDPAMRKAAPQDSDAKAIELLDQVADHLLALFPETATSLGIDTGPRAALRSRLTDRTEAGKQRIRGQIRADLDRVNAFDPSGLSPNVR